MPDAPSVPDALLGDLSPATFLEDYWQKKPLMVRGALPDFRSPLEPEELAGLACEDGVASRLILEEGGAEPWELREGPFDEEDFLGLPETKWTLLVQEVDRLIPEVGRLLDRFSFLPRWRMDDVMVSYAPTGGNVGAHIDNYDVFLVQGLGHRRWMIGDEPVDDETIVPDLDVRILADFEADREFVLGPGDMLYLPPRVAHHGVATDDRCMTYSVGFRAPSHRDIAGSFLQYALDELVDPDARYADPDLTPTGDPGAIRPAARKRVRSILHSLLSDDDAIDRWFGEHMTRPQRDSYATPRQEPLKPWKVEEAIRGGAALRPGPATRMAHIEHDDGSATLFVNGRSFDLAADHAGLASVLTGTRRIAASALKPHLDDEAVAVLAELVNEGLLEFAS